MQTYPFSFVDLYIFFKVLAFIWNKSSKGKGNNYLGQTLIICYCIIKYKTTFNSTTAKHIKGFQKIIYMIKYKFWVLHSMQNHLEIYICVCSIFFFYFVDHSPLNNLIWKKTNNSTEFNQFTSLVLPSVSGVTVVRWFVYISSGIFLRVGNGPGQRDGWYHQNKKQH